jgi:hypothetical protein
LNGAKIKAVQWMVGCIQNTLLEVIFCLCCQNRFPQYSILFWEFPSSIY